MQRGQLPLEAIIQIILRVLGVAVLIAILVMLVRVFLPSTATPGERDFQRVLTEIDDVIKQPYSEDITLKVPVTQGVQVIAYAGGSSGAAQCKGKPCICLNDATKETCKVYSSLKTQCSVVCSPGGQAECLRNSVARVENGVVTIKRSCNAIGFEGVEV